VLVIEKKFYGLFVAAILLAGPLLGSVPAAFADPTTLEEKCAKQTDVKKPPDCELLQRLNDLEAELKAKDMALMEKDMQLMNTDLVIINDLNRKIAILSAAMQQDDSVCDNIPDADFIADTSLVQLCDQADVWIANYQALCNNVPLFDDAIGIVDTSIVAVLGASNTALGAVNSAFNSLRNFEFNVNINVPGPIPGFDVNFGKLLSFLPASPIPSIPGNVIGIVDVKLDQVADCSII